MRDVAQAFDRATFEATRASEYFIARELATLTGQPPKGFATVLMKELADNGLDAAEAKGVPPQLTFEVNVDGELLTITVTDNGPGIPPETVAKVLDFSTRTSDKAAYRSPTRGAQGNALKTVIGMPHALGGFAPVIIEACGVRHQIRAWVDPAGEVRIEPVQNHSPRTDGTRIEVIIPAEVQEFNPLFQARAIALVNPHAFVQIAIRDLQVEQGQSGVAENSKIDEMYKSLVACPPWTKWLPTYPIPVAWYDKDSFERLIFLHIGQSRRPGGRDLPLGEFVRQFRGLARSAAAKKITKLFPEIHRLSDFESRPEVLRRLLAAMESNSRPVPARVLGLIGEAQFRARFEEWYGVERFWYAKESGEADGLPFTLEAVLAHTEEEETEDHFFALNFSPVYDDPLGRSWFKLAEDCGGYGLGGLLSDAHAGDFPHAFAFHLTMPAFRFLDRGKSTIAIEGELGQAAERVLWKVLQVAYKEGERRRKRRARAEREEKKLERTEAITIKDAVFAVLMEAWNNATDNETYPVSARMLYYPVRKLIQQHTSKDLDFSYFSQTLLIEWQEEHGPLKGLYFDPRGVFHEAHSDKTLPLGTLEVADYKFPEHVFNKILYIEKKGVIPVLEAARIGERYDLGIIAGEGYATEATRKLFERADQGDYRLLVLHDADPDGYNICRTLSEATRRMPGYSVAVTDLGLRLEEALAMELQTERFSRQKALASELELSDLERQYFEGERVGKHWLCQRIELNAMTPPVLVAYLERKLREAGADDKVIPPREYLDAYQERVGQDAVRKWVTETGSKRLGFDEITRVVERQLGSSLRRNSPESLARALAEDRSLSWRTVADRDIEQRIEANEHKLMKTLANELERRMRELGKR
jgi:DNA topoisomerase VI subunit B